MERYLEYSAHDPTVFDEFVPMGEFVLNIQFVLSSLCVLFQYDFFVEYYVKIKIVRRFPEITGHFSRRVYDGDQGNLTKP